jgi:hypothetical protein
LERSFFRKKKGNSQPIILILLLADLNDEFFFLLEIPELIQNDQTTGFGTVYITLEPSSFPNASIVQWLLYQYIIFG